MRNAKAGRFSLSFLFASISILVMPVQAAMDWVEVRHSIADGYDHDMVYYPKMEKVILNKAVGIDKSSETWAWDGTEWSLLPVSNGPGDTCARFMVYDSKTEKLLMLFTEGYELIMRWYIYSWTGDEWNLENSDLEFDNVLYYPGICYDSYRERLVLFGGYLNHDDYTNHLWEWDGTNWEQRTPTVLPTARSAFAMDYDKIRNEIVIFGGRNEDEGVLNETWSWDGSEWEKKQPDHSPSSRSHHIMVFDSDRGVMVMYGGVNNKTDTWEWDGTDWLKIETENNPGERLACAMTYDAVRKNVVLFGGYGHNTEDTWTYDGEDWHYMEPPDGLDPLHRWGHNMVYDSNRNVTILFGGRGGSYFSDTWEWDGELWHLIETMHAPEDLFCDAMTYDPVRQKTVLFGAGSGIDKQTWEYDGTDWTQCYPPGWKHPSTYQGHRMIYHPVRNTVIIFGGAIDYHLPEGYIASDVMKEWDGESWIKIPKTDPWPPPLMDMGMTYDSHRNRIVI